MKTLLAIFPLLLLLALPLSGAELIATGAKVTFYATADGDPAPTFEWFKGDVLVGEGPTYIIPSMTKEDAGSYTAKATNVAGSAVSDALVLAVATKPTKPVIRITAERPGDVTLSVQPGIKVVVQR
jgi:hypothetical protein